MASVFDATAITVAVALAKPESFDLGAASARQRWRPRVLTAHIVVRIERERRERAARSPWSRRRGAAGV